MKFDARGFQRVNEIKADFNGIYTAPDPREYYRVLFGLDYVIPELAKPIIRRLVARRSRDGRIPKVIDVGCSYGINAALLRFPLDLRRIAARYASAEMQSLNTAALFDLDRKYFASWPRLHNVTMVGQDVSVPAIKYGLATGVLDQGISTNLEEQEPNSVDRSALAGADLIVSTGCVGYVTAKTFRRILEVQPSNKLPWIATFVLRMFPYETFVDELRRFGLVTEKVEGMTFVQRRFHSRGEFEATVDTLRARGIDTANKESEGLLHAELYISRPPKDVQAVPLGDLISITSGAQLPYGRRFVEIAGEPRLML